MSESLIMLTGGIGCGKSTVAGILKEEFKYHEIMFAGPLKEIGKVLGFSEHQMHGTQEQKLEVNPFWGISARRFLQVFGSEVMRDLLPKALPDMNMNEVTIWARIAENKIEQHKKIVISDGRFEDEARMVRRNGGVVIKIERTCKGKEPDVVKKLIEANNINNISALGYNDVKKYQDSFIDSCIDHTEFLNILRSA